MSYKVKYRCGNTLRFPQAADEPSLCYATLVVSPRPFLLQESPCISFAGMDLLDKRQFFNLRLHTSVGRIRRLLREEHVSEDPAAAVFPRGRLSTRRPVATPALARPVLRRLKPCPRKA